MVVGYFNVACFAVGERETYAPLVVDPDAPLPCPVAGKGLKAVRLRHQQIRNLTSIVQLSQAHDRAGKDFGRELFGFSRGKEFFRFLVPE